MTRKTAKPYRPARRIVQVMTLVIIALIPASGLLRIDLTTASFLVMNHEVSWSNFSLVAGLALITATGPILTYLTIGPSWCGWACPQNLLSELANKFTQALLGKRASVDVREELILAPSKNSLWNWARLGFIFLAASLVLAIIPFLFFFSPTEIWSFATADANHALSTFMRRLYWFMVGVVFLDIALIRYFWCDYFCLYRIGQKIFTNPEALHIRYDESRSADCTKCNYCSTACITKIQPTQIHRYDPCIDCGECVDACNRLHQKSDEKGLLTFEVGEAGQAGGWWSPFRKLLKGARGAVTLTFLAGVFLTIWSVATLPQAAAQLPAEVRARNHQILESCNQQCSVDQGQCKNGSLGACYRTAACKCSCYLNEDPTNPERPQWEACVKLNSDNAQKTLSNHP
jgi:hypothetical protein